MATAFAVFCATDGSLIFYNRDTVPTAGDEFEGKVASNVYTGFNTTIYNSVSSVPWYNENTSIISVSFTSEFTTVKPISTKSWFYGATNMTSFDGANLDTSSVTNMSGMFSMCEALTSLDLSNFDTSNVTKMSSMFYDCSSLTTLDVSSFDTSNVTDMRNMFDNCNDLTSLDLSSFDISKITDMSSMFYGCSSLTSLDLSSFDTSNVIDMGGMFGQCYALTTLDLSNFNTSNVTNMNSMFYCCYALTSLDLSSFNTSKITDMSEMFCECSSLTSLDVSSFDTSNVTDMGMMFYYCKVLTTIYVSDLWTIDAVTNSTNMFSSCTNLIGAISYNSSKIDITYANYTTGYLTFRFIYPENRFVITGADLNRVANALREKIGAIAGLSFPDGFIAAIESIKFTTKVEATDDGSGNVVVSMDGSSTDDSAGNVVIS